MIGATLRVKNKTIIISILLLLFGILLCVLAGPSYLMGQARAADQVRAVALYDRVLKFFPWNEFQAGEALYWSALTMPVEQSFEAYIFAGQSGYQGSLEAEQEDRDGEILNRTERLQLLLERYPDHRMSRWHAPYVLGVDLMRSGHTAEGVAWLERAISDPESRQVPSAALDLYSYYTRTGQHAEAARVVKTSLERSPDSMAPQMYVNLGRAHLALGEYQAAEQAFNRVLPAFEEEQRRMTEHRFGEDGMPAREFRGEMWLEARVAEGLDQAQSGRQGYSAYDTAVSGSVLQGGQPLSGMYIILAATDQGYGMMIPPPDGLHHETLTGPDGSFEFSGVAPGDYQVGLRLTGADARTLTGYHLLIRGGDFSLEEGTLAEVAFNFALPVSLVGMQGNPESGLTVEWEPYPGAESYNVMLGASFKGGTSITGTTTPVYYDYSETEAIFQPLDFYQFYGVSKDMEGILPTSVAGFLVGADEVWLDIEALDREGVVLSSLRGLRFTYDRQIPGFIDNSGVKRSKADELLRERRYRDAIAAYEAELAADPDNLHALACLFQVYRRGTHGPPGTGEGDRWPDRVMALEYGKRLADLTGDKRIIDLVDDLEFTTGL